MSTKCKYMCIYHIHKLTRVYHIKKVNTHVYYTQQVLTQSFQYLLRFGQYLNSDSAYSCNVTDSYMYEEKMA